MAGSDKATSFTPGTTTFPFQLLTGRRINQTKKILYPSQVKLVSLWTFPVVSGQIRLQQLVQVNYHGYAKSMLVRTYYDSSFVVTISLLTILFIDNIDPTNQKDERGDQLPCPKTWTSINGRCYMPIATKVPWFEAESKCQNLGGHLASAKL